jgi:hypothetical protein
MASTASSSNDFLESKSQQIEARLAKIEKLTEQLEAQLEKQSSDNHVEKWAAIKQLGFYGAIVAMVLSAVSVSKSRLK